MDRSHEVRGYPFDWRKGSRPLGVPGFAAIISYTYFFLLFMLLPIWRVIRLVFHKLQQRRQRRRLARNLCVNCAYDLRAHAAGGKCPECGTLISAQSGK